MRPMASEALVNPTRALWARRARILLPPSSFLTLLTFQLTRLVFHVDVCVCVCCVHVCVRVQCECVYVCYDYYGFYQHNYYNS